MTTYTPAQLEAWAGLGPWSYRSQKHDDWGIVRTGLFVVCQARDHQFMDDCYLLRCREERRDPHEIPARLIAAAPDLARLVLEKEKEIARLKAALKTIANANGSERPDASWDASTLLLELRKLARQAMKETSDE